MESGPSFQFYTGDRLKELMPFIGDSEAVGAWCKAWMYLWGAGPTEPSVLAQVAGKGWDKVGFLFTEKDGLLSLEWMEKKREETARFKKKQRDNGKKGGRPKARESKGKNPGLSSGLTQNEPKQSPRVLRAEGEGEVEGITQEKKERASASRLPGPKIHEPEIIPEGVTPPTWEAIKRWEKYRSESRLKLTPSGRQAFIKKCIERGEQRAIAAIDHSITMGWQGCYEPDQRSQNGGQQSMTDEQQFTDLATHFAGTIRQQLDRDQAGGGEHL